MKNILKKLLMCTTLLASIKAQDILLKPCYRENILDCPKYSLCSNVNSTDKNTLKCLCLIDFELNTNWPEFENSTNSTLLNEHYCLPTNNATTTGTEKLENKLIVYIRSPASKEHLAFGILMVLLAATLATALLYGLTVLRPIKRTKAVYKKLRYKRQNMTPLQEMDELELNRRYEMQTL